MKEKKSRNQGIFRESVEREENFFSEFFLNSMDVSVFNADFLMKTILQRMEDIQARSMEEYFSRMENDTVEVNLLKNSLFVGYSEFFRNPLTFAVLERIIFPAVLAQNQHFNRKEIRIWSAACAGGQEAYSLAILLEELNKGREMPWNYRIFATDKSVGQVDEARRGVFSQQALAKMTLSWSEQWFEKQEEMYVVKPELKRCIDFSVFDLLDKTNGCPSASIFGSFDIVFCSNVLFYYKTEFRTAILEKVTGCLSKDGYIVVSEVERDFMLNSLFREVYPQSGIFRNKERI